MLSKADKDKIKGGTVTVIRPSNDPEVYDNIVDADVGSEGRLRLTDKDGRIISIGDTVTRIITPKKP